MVQDETDVAACGPLAVKAVLRLDSVQRQALLDDRELPLTGTEFRLLACLSSQPGRVWSRKELLAAGIAGEAKVLERTIDVHIRALRAKLGDFDSIETVRRVGYRYRAQSSEPAEDGSSCQN